MAIFPNSLGFLIFSFSIICSVFYPVSGGGAVNVGFPPLVGIHPWKDASIFNDQIQLTKASGDRTSSFGWVTYATSIPLCDYSSRATASFYTHFQFTITSFADRDNSDGLTFFLARPDWKPSDANAGNNLGLFRSETDGMPSNQIFAVEFDTFKNDAYDPDNNHVGFNFNSVKSRITFSVSGLYKGAALKNGKIWYAWVDYNSSNALPELQLFLAQNLDGTIPSKPERPVLICPVDLCQYLPQNIMVGFSASTGIVFEIHTLHSWSFSSQHSWNTSSTPTLNTSSTPTLWSTSSTPTLNTFSTATEWNTSSTPTDWNTSSTPPPPTDWNTSSTPSTPTEWNTSSTPTDWDTPPPPTDWDTSSTPSNPTDWDTSSTPTNKQKKRSTRIALVVSILGSLAAFLVAWFTNYLCTGNLWFKCCNGCQCCSRWSCCNG